MTTFVTTVQAVSNILFGLLALVALRLYWNHRNTGAAWVAGAFASIGSVVVVGQAMPVVDPPIVLVKVLVLGILAVPWCLHRFVVSMDGIGRILGVVFDASVAGLAVATLLFSRFPGPEEEPSRAMAAYTIAFIGVWAILLLRTTWRLARASRGQPGVIQSRLQMLAAGTFGLTMALALPTVLPEGEGGELAGALFAMFSVVFFLTGFAPPKGLRSGWRSDDDDELQAATSRLMMATTRDDVATTVLPSVVALMGADAAALVSSRGEIRLAIGVDPHEVADLLAAAPSLARIVTIELARGDTLVIRTSPYAPLFGEDERRLMLRLVALIDLAVDRADLLGSERTARQDAERANREVEAFVATITHDLRNPLTAIVGMSDLLNGPLRDQVSDQASNFIERISANADYMTGMVTDILDLASINASTMDSDPVDLALVASIVREELALRETTAEVVVGALPTIRGDRTHIRRLFENIVNNAVKHAGRPDVRVTITSTQSAQVLHLSFQDNGKGIPMEAAERVFGLFEQMKGSDGSGLGLAICRKLVESMGGKLWFEPSGVGADLRINLPAELIVADVETMPVTPNVLANARVTADG